MASTCKRGHAMVGENIKVYGVAKQTRCRTCFEEYQRNRNRRTGRPPRRSSGTAGAPLDPALLAELRRQVGFVADEPAR